MGPGQDLSLQRGKDLGQDQSLLRETSLDPDLGPGLNLQREKDPDLRNQSPDLDQDPAQTGEIKDPGQGVLSKKIRKQEEDLQFRRMEIDQDPNLKRLKKGLTMVLMIDMQAFKKKKHFLHFV